jgi:DNA (cytosine-5)-methyltransferase 1
MNHKEKLKSIYNLSFLIDDIKNITQEYKEYIGIIGNNVYQQKGVYTVLITLITHKILFPTQDIRNHQDNMEGGFSGRTIDTKFITPTLKELQLPAMAESGWLTRSLEQPYPYTLDYQGNISNKQVKTAFLQLIDYVEKRPELSENILRLLLNKVIEVKNKNNIEIKKITNPDRITIPEILSCLEEHFFTKYVVRGRAKLSVIAIYAIYKSLIHEVKRYDHKVLANLGSDTASDLTSQTSGDIQVFDENGHIFEAVEIKHDKIIDITMLRNAYEKIKKFHLKRYYILSLMDIKTSEKEEIKNLIEEIRKYHGCQVIINGIMPTIKYYLRLISVEKFINDYSDLVMNDRELQSDHKQKWKELVEKLDNL